MKVLVLSAVLLAGCRSAPIRVSPAPNVAAVRTQNEQTRKHISSTRQHIDRSSAAQVKVEASLEAAKKDLELLLRWINRA